MVGGVVVRSIAREVAMSGIGGFEAFDAQWAQASVKPASTKHDVSISFEWFGQLFFL